MTDIKEWENPCLSISKDCLTKRSTLVVFLLNHSLLIFVKKNKRVKGSGKHNKLHSKGSLSFKGFFHLENAAFLQVEKYLWLQQELNNVLRNYGTKRSYFSRSLGGQERLYSRC